MTCRNLLLVMATALVFSTPAAMDQEDTDPAQAEQIVVPAEGVTDFSVTGRSTLFRIPVSTIAGGSIDDPVIHGKARLVRSAKIIMVGEGGTPLIGSHQMEFVFQGTAEGEVRIEIRKTYPATPEPEVKIWNVTIK